VRKVGKRSFGDKTDRLIARQTAVAFRWISQRAKKKLSILLAEPQTFLARKLLLINCGVCVWVCAVTYLFREKRAKMEGIDI
jgi:hypothetical protein